MHIPPPSQYLPWPSRVRMWQQLPHTFLRHSLKRSEAYLAAVSPLSVLMACQNPPAERTSAGKALAAAMSADVLAPLLAETNLWPRATHLHLSLAQSTGNFTLTMLHNDLFAQASSVITGESPLLSALNASSRRERYKGSSPSALASHTLSRQPLRAFMKDVNSAIEGKTKPLQAAAALWAHLLQLRDQVLGARQRLVQHKSARSGAAQSTPQQRAAHASSVHRAPKERMAVEDDSGDEDENYEQKASVGEYTQAHKYLPPGDESLSLHTVALACIQAACDTDSTLNNMPGYPNLFQQPVVEQFPQLRKSYISVIHNPIDLGTMRFKVAGGEYSDLSEVHDDVMLMLDNARLFNKGEAYTIRSAEQVCTAFNIVAKAAVGRVQLHLRGPAFERDPQEEPEDMRQVAQVHRGGLLQGGLGGLGVGPHAQEREEDATTEAHFTARYCVNDTCISLGEALHMCHAAAWQADAEEIVASVPDGAAREFQAVFEGCFRRPLQRTLPSLAHSILKQVPHPVDLATMQNRIQDARYSSLESAREEISSMGAQATLVLGEGHALLPAFNRAWQAITAAWDAEAAFLAPRVSPPPPPELVQGAIAQRKEAFRASQKATATMKAPLIAPVDTSTSMSRLSLKRSADGHAVSSADRNIDPSALASEVVRSRAAAEGSAQAKAAAAAAEPAPQLRAYPDAVKRQTACPEFATFQAACLVLQDPRLVRVLCDALFDIAKVQVKTGTPLRQSQDAALLLALLPVSAAQYAPLFSKNTDGVPLLGSAASSKTELTRAVPAQSWAGATLATAAIMQVHLNRAGIAAGPSSAKPDDSEVPQALAAEKREALTLTHDSLACPQEDGLDALLLGAAASPSGWQLALRLVLPRLKSNARMAICLLKALGWVTTCPGSRLGTPALVCCLASSVARVLVDLCPRAQAQLAARHKIVEGKVHSRMYTDASTQHIAFVMLQWLPALVQWAGRQAVQSKPPTAVARRQAMLSQGVPVNRQDAVLDGSDSSQNAWRHVVLPVLLQSWFDVADAACTARMFTEAEQGHFLHLFLQLGGQVAYFHAKDCSLPAPSFAPGAVLPEGTACCPVSALLQARVFRGFQYKLKAWLKRLELAGLPEVYEHSVGAPPASEGGGT